jgi:hypothetical protein
MPRRRRHLRRRSWRRMMQQQQQRPRRAVEETRATSASRIASRSSRLALRARSTATPLVLAHLFGYDACSEPAVALVKPLSRHRPRSSRPIVSLLAAPDCIRAQPQATACAAPRCAAVQHSVGAA